MELWKRIKGFPNYSISNLGRVKRGNRILRTALDSNGYPHVILYKDGKKYHGYIHRLVAIAFVPNPNNYTEINHIDGNKLHSESKNLEWCTHAENVRHSFKTGVRTRKCARKPVLCVETGMVYPTVKAAAKGVNRSATAIHKCLHGWTRTAGGYHWKYDDSSEKLSSVTVIA